MLAVGPRLSAGGTNDQGVDISGHVTIAVATGMITIDYDPVQYRDAIVFVDAGSQNDPATGQPLIASDRNKQFVFRTNPLISVQQFIGSAQSNTGVRIATQQLS